MNQSETTTSPTRYENYDDLKDLDVENDINIHGQVIGIKTNTDPKSTRYIQILTNAFADCFHDIFFYKPLANLQHGLHPNNPNMKFSKAVAAKYKQTWWDKSETTMHWRVYDNDTVKFAEYLEKDFNHILSKARTSNKKTLFIIDDITDLKQAERRVLDKVVCRVRHANASLIYQTFYSNCIHPLVRMNTSYCITAPTSEKHHNKHFYENFVKHSFDMSLDSFIDIMKDCCDNEKGLFVINGNDTRLHRKIMLC